MVLEILSSMANNLELSNAQFRSAGTAWNMGERGYMLGVEHSLPKDCLNVRSGGMEKMIRQIDCTDLHKT